MKTTSNIIKILSQICWLCVHVFIALWAAKQIVIMSRELRYEIAGKDLVVGRIVR